MQARLSSAVWGLVGVFVGAAVVGVATSQQEELTAKAVRAEGFVLLDEAGETRAMLTIEDSRPRLSFVDETGEERAAIGLLGIETSRDYAPLDPEMEAAFDEAGLMSMPPRKVVQRDVGPGMALRDKAGKLRAKLIVDDVGGEPSVKLYDRGGGRRVVVGSVETEETRLVTPGPDLAIAIEETKRPVSTITLFGEGGGVRWQAP